MVLIGWVTWSILEGDERKEIRDMLAITDEDIDPAKEHARQDLTKEYLKEGKTITQLTLRRYLEKPVWLADRVWNQLNGEEPISMTRFKCSECNEVTELVVPPDRTEIERHCPVCGEETLWESQEES